MCGGIPLDQAYLLDKTDRTIIQDLIQENLDTAKKTKQPFW